MLARIASTGQTGLRSRRNARAAGTAGYHGSAASATRCVISRVWRSFRESVYSRSAGANAPMSMNPSRRILAEITRSGDRMVDLGQAALLIAQEDYPGLEVRPYIAKLDALAASAAAVTQGLAPEEATIALVEHLFNKEGFRGNEDNYYDPRNSYLNEVLDRRLGIPITLALVAMEVARRLRLPLVGVGLPGHFVLRYSSRGELIFDPFRGGRRLTLEDCRELV